MVDDYVFGYVFRTGQIAASFTRIGDRGDHRRADAAFRGADPLRRVPAPRSALFGDGDVRETWELVVETMTADGRFEEGLGLLLDGIQAKLEPRDG